MMFRTAITTFCLLLLLIVPSVPRAVEVNDIDAGTLELGVILGEPTGVSVKFWTTWETAVDVGVAWSFRRHGHITIHADYLFHNFNFFKIEDGRLPVYAGVGGRLRVEDDDTRIGIRIPVGAEYILEAYPFSVFLEIAPVIDLVPETGTELNGGLGFRYIF